MLYKLSWVDVYSTVLIRQWLLINVFQIVIEHNHVHIFHSLYLSIWDIVHISWNALHRCGFSTAPRTYLAQDFCHSQGMRPNIAILEAMGNWICIQNIALWSRRKYSVIYNYIWEQEQRYYFKTKKIFLSFFPSIVQVM